MDSFTSTIMFGIFLLAVLLFIYIFHGTFQLGIGRSLKSAEKPEVDLNEFLRRGIKKANSKKRYLFLEENLVSMTYRYNGRFDSVLVSWMNGPILEAVIERKFPRSHLPSEPISEDIFQASLYALALKEKGLSVRTTRIITIYCPQEEAEKCLERRGSSNCLGCSKGVNFSKKFSEHKTVKALEKLDEVWYRGRNPSPQPSNRTCRICPYSKDGLCNFAAV